MSAEAPARPSERTRERVWPVFRDAWILHADEAWIVVDKPAGMPAQEAEASRRDGLVTRLGEWLAARGEDPYLGVHQRLDQETSGVVVMTRRRDVNAAIAAQFERRRVAKTYLAGVTGLPRRIDRTTVRAPLDGKPAVTHVRVRARKEDRAIVELVLETGRTHQARRHLHGLGAPIAGDALYQGARAPRLLLHAHAITLAHPVSGRSATFTAAPPPELEDWLARGDPGMRVWRDAGAIDRALARAALRRYALGRSDATTAFRLVNEAGDGLEGLAVDVYGAHLVAQLYGDFADAERERALDRLDALGFDGVYLKVRPRQANTLVDTRREDLAPKLPVRGTATSEDEIVVLEEGVPYGVRLGDGLSTGIFLDQRSNRARVRATSGGARVLNLFAYTCGFTVTAALGGAASTVSVDASVAALERGRANLARVGALEGGGATHAFVADDAFAWLARATKKKEPRFDLVILDPPSYSTTRARRFVAADHYAELVEAAVRVLGPHGRLLASTNHRGIPRAKLRRAVAQGVRAAGRDAAQLKDLPDPLDFPAPAGEEPHMKSVLVTLV